ncbi:DUF742 domain-containing protein [Actinomadura sp. KC216]|uniref:DUF742 domain-containing protein n=1 Tax=Actinomadura sp. KC216 TaxID=2530370 RepID=UPI00104EE5D2|nr:DUF742 domain-containing protein [Actinomadura sp. KC216]TDB85433.1 DUF742 domain-containing protein [Actinomadura sp. KC216]
MDPGDAPGAPDHGGPGRERWLDAAAGPIVRPYAVTRGRTRPNGEPLDIVAILVATGRRPADPGRLSRHQRRLLALCRRPHALADLASDLDLPLGVIRVLVGDLLDSGLVDVQRWTGPSGDPLTGLPGTGLPHAGAPHAGPAYANAPYANAPHTDPNLLRRVLDELRAL